MNDSTFAERMQTDDSKALAELFIARVRQPSGVGPALNARLLEDSTSVFYEKAEQGAAFRACLEKALALLLDGRATHPDTRMVPRSSELSPNEVTHQACRMIMGLELTGTWTALFGWLERHWPSRTTERAAQDYEDVLCALAYVQPPTNDRLLAFWRRAWRETSGDLKSASFNGLRRQSPKAAAALLPTLRQEIDLAVVGDPPSVTSFSVDILLWEFWDDEDSREVLRDALTAGLAAHAAWAAEALEALKKCADPEELQQLPPVA